MSIQQVFEIQKKMEANIKKYTSIDEDALGHDNTFHLLFLALQVKVGELANLTKCYKYKKYEVDYVALIPKDKIKYRYIDALKYLVSIGIKYQYDMIDESTLTIDREANLISGFSSLYSEMEALKKLTREENYIAGLKQYVRVLNNFLTIGSLLNLTYEEINTFYTDNFKRFVID